MTDAPLPAESSDDPEEGTDSEEGVIPEVVADAEPEEVADAEVVGNSAGVPSIEMAMYQREGPLPPPAELQAYYDIHPDICFRLVGMAENTANARQEGGRDRRRFNERVERSASRIMFAMVLCLTVIVLALIGASAWVIVSVNAWVGVGVLVVSPTAVLLAAVSLLRRFFRRIGSDDDEEEEEDGTGDETPEA